MRKGGLEPPRSCERQPLKLVRLPIPPLPQKGQLAVLSQPSVDAAVSVTREQGTTGHSQADESYFFGAWGGVGAGALGAGALDVGVLCFGAFSMIDPEVCRVAQTDNVIEVAIKMAPSPQVIFAMVETAPRGPKAAWLTPPKAAVMSTFSPPWISTSRMSRILIRM